MEKKYTLHILAIRAINADTFDLPIEQNAIIVCTNRDNIFINQCLPQNTLIMNFPDVENNKCIGAFTNAHARKIISFIRNLPNEVTDIYICCSKGGSRSPAIAAALLRMSGRSDKAVWHNPYYTPNTLVYLKLCQEYGFTTNWFSVKIRTLINDLCFYLTQKGIPTRYERWQILE